MASKKVINKSLVSEVDAVEPVGKGTKNLRYRNPGSFKGLTEYVGLDESDVVLDVVPSGASGKDPGTTAILPSTGAQYYVDANGDWQSLSGGGGATNLSIGTVTTTTVQVNSDTGTNAIIPAVTISTAGVMSSADKTKLDGIEVLAKDDQVASEVPVIATGFSGQLSATDTDVQTALATLDGIVIPDEVIENAGTLSGAAPI